MIIVNIFVAGLIVLLVAIVANGLSSLLQVTSWYDFINNKQIPNFASMIWLFIVYPMILGVAVYIGSKLF